MHIIWQRGFILARVQDLLPDEPKTKRIEPSDLTPRLALQASKSNHMSWYCQGMGWAELLRSSTLEQLLKWWATLQVTFVIPPIFPEIPWKFLHVAICGIWITFQWVWDIPSNCIQSFNQVEASKLQKGSLLHWKRFQNQVSPSYCRSYCEQFNFCDVKAKSSKRSEMASDKTRRPECKFMQVRLLLRTVEAHFPKPEILKAPALPLDNIPPWSTVLKSWPI